MTFPTGQVDLPRLERVGTAVRLSAESFSKAYSSHAHQLKPAGAVTGWGATSAVVAAADGWAAFMAYLAGQVRGLGGDLSTAARQYHATDAGAAAYLAGIPAGHPAQGFAQNRTR